MSILTEIESEGRKVGEVFLEVVTFAKKMQTIYSALSGPTIAACSAVFYDCVKCVAAGQAAAVAGESANIPLTISLSETTLTLVQKVIADAKAGEQTIVADFKALDITL